MTKNKEQSGQIRIIAGQWRSRKLPILKLDGLRPTTDRVKETVFNWLQPYLPGANCLDLFAGSGSLGFEAGSRGAEQVVLVEQDSLAAKQLVENIDFLAAEQMSVFQMDALTFIQECDAKFDVVLIDPPYQSQLLGKACQLLEQYQCLSKTALIYLETANADDFQHLPDNWRLTKRKKAGQVHYGLAIRAD